MQVLLRSRRGGEAESFTSGLVGLYTSSSFVFSKEFIAHMGALVP